MATGCQTLLQEFVRTCSQSASQIDRFTKIIGKLALIKHLTWQEKDHILTRLQIQNSQMLHAYRILDVFESQLIGKTIRSYEGHRVGEDEASRQYGMFPDNVKAANRSLDAQKEIEKEIQNFRVYCNINRKTS